jgi:hypothetical protein
MSYFLSRDSMAETACSGVDRVPVLLKVAGFGSLTEKVGGWDFILAYQNPHMLREISGHCDCQTVGPMWLVLHAQASLSDCQIVNCPKFSLAFDCQALSPAKRVWKLPLLSL